MLLKYTNMHLSYHHIGSREVNSLTNRWRDDRVGLYDRVLPQLPKGDLFMAIPRGKRCNLWFTYYRESPVCFVLETNRSNDIVNISIVPASFNRALAYGTVLSGVMTNHAGSPVFCVAIVQKALGVPCKRSAKDQLSNMKKVLDLIGGHKLPVIQITSPDLFTSYEDFTNSLCNFKYPIYGVKVCDTVRDHCLGIVTVEIKKSKECVLLVKPEVNEDLYSLWSGSLVGYALIPDIKTSRLLNSIFRYVKENDNLDEIEESDDEDEFENIDEDRFIKTPLGLTMNVSYDYKHKGWVPISLSNSPPTIMDEVKNIESKVTFHKNEVKRSAPMSRDEMRNRKRQNQNQHIRKGPMRFIG